MGLLNTDPTSAGLLGLGLRLMATPGSFGQAFGTSGLGAINDMQEARMRQLIERRTALEDEARRVALQRAMEEQQQRAKDMQLTRTMMEDGAQGPTMPNDPRMFLSRGGSLEGVQNLMGLNAAMTPRAPKYSTTLQYDQAGRAFMVSESGEVKYLDGVKSRDKLVPTDLGGKVVLRSEYSPEAIGELTKTQTPDSVSGNSVTMRGQNMTDSRAREAMAMQRELASAKQAQEAKPGSAVARAQDASDVLQLLKQAEPLIDKSTASYAGAGIDQIARVFGQGTLGADAAAQLKTLQGVLISKMPKMSGPQSDKDVQLYREMAGQIGDSTLPRSTRKAAIDTIRTINERYAGIEGDAKQGASSGPVSIQSDSEYNALPSGATFVGPDGKTRRKP
jgi:hypothetical protein